MRRTDALIIGGGQAGLAMSRCLADLGVDHVVLERGRVAERWRSERWDSLRLLTPRWQSRLPGWRYRGPDPDGYMTMPEVISYLAGYARSFSAPVEAGTTVQAVRPIGAGYQVATDHGTWLARNVVIATGHCDEPRVPTIAAGLSPRVHQVVPGRYRNPRQLPDGGVLIVGASATGVQLADEIHASGRPVTLAVGHHIRLPRRYRGSDIMWWLDRMGVLDETEDHVFDLAASRAQPSLQLVGRPDHRTLDLGILHGQGVRLVGRAVAAEGERVSFAADLDQTIARADAKLAALLARIDRFIEGARPADAVTDEGRAPVIPVRPATAPTALDLRTSQIGTVVWATGYRRRYPWLQVPVLDERGEICHRGGITPAPGLYVLGLGFLRRRKSNFIDGVGADARALAAHLAGRLDRAQRPAA